MRLVGDWVCEGVMRRTALYSGDDNDGNRNMGSEARFVLGGLSGFRSNAYCVASAEGLSGFRSRDC